MHTTYLELQLLLLVGLEATTLLYKLIRVLLKYQLSGMHQIISQLYFRLGLKGPYDFKMYLYN